MRSSRLQKILVTIDALVLVGLICALLASGVNLGRRADVLIVLTLFVGFGMNRGNGGLEFSYYSKSIKTYAWALLFAEAYFVFTERWIDSLWALVILSVWLLISIVVRRLLSGSMRKTQLAIPNLKNHTLTSYSKVDYQVIDIPEELNKSHAKGLVIIKGHSYSEKWRRLIAHCQVIGFPIITTDELEERLSGKVAFEELNQSWIQNSYSTNKTYVMIKRISDIACTLVFSPILLLLGLLVGITIAIKMKRPIFFTQQRVGQDNKTFTIYKFRTMSTGHNAEETRQDDPRITPLGHILRKSRLDELPQFWNILKGDMSLIGPRPEWTHTAQTFNQEISVYSLRALVKPGITGWAQVNQGHTTGVDGNTEKLRHDIYYIKHFSFWLDLRIVMLTIVTLLTGFGAK